MLSDCRCNLMSTGSLNLNTFNACACAHHVNQEANWWVGIAPQYFLSSHSTHTVSQCVWPLDYTDTYCTANILRAETQHQSFVLLSLAPVMSQMTCFQSSFKVVMFLWLLSHSTRRSTRILGLLRGCQFTSEVQPMDNKVELGTHQSRWHPRKPPLHFIYSPAASSLSILSLVIHVPIIRE